MTPSASRWLVGPDKIRADEYEAIVREVLAHLPFGAEHITAVVGESLRR
jgi:hypothetical protein